jgi:hypothetical protein
MIVDLVEIGDAWRWDVCGPGWKQKGERQKSEPCTMLQVVHWFTFLGTKYI